MPEIIKISDLPLLSEAGFAGGRDNFHAFCKAIFSDRQPRYFRTKADALVVFNHADLMAFGTAPQIGNVPPGILFPGTMDAPPDAEAAPGKRIAEVLSAQVFTTNPPIHGASRRILLNWIGPKQVTGMEGIVRDLVDNILDAMDNGTEVDFVPSVSEALTIGFWSKLLDLTADEIARITQATREMNRLFIIDRTEEDLRALDRAFDDYAKVLDDAAKRGLENGNADLLEIQRQLQELNFEEDINSVGVYPRTVSEVLSGNLIDGFHTAALASANTCYTLSRHPHVLDEVRGSSQLLAKAISESLRLEPPVLLLRRYVLEDFEYDGMIVPRGTQVVMMWAAGNLDPKAFPEPYEFDLHRRHQGMTVFGNGIHICPGRYVGIMLTRILLEGLEARNMRLRPGQSAAEWIPGYFMSQLRSLPIAIERRAEE